MPDLRATSVHQHPDSAPHEDQEKRVADATVSLVWVTGVLAFFTALLWVATYRLAREAQVTSARQATETARALTLSEEMARAASKSAQATEAALTSNRAWLLLSEVSASRAPDDPTMDRFNIQVLFQLRNFGATPAILDAIEASAYWIEENPFYEPIVGSEESKRFAQRMRSSPHMQGDSGPVPLAGSPPFDDMPFEDVLPTRHSYVTNQVIVEGNSLSRPIEFRFNFQHGLLQNDPAFEPVKRQMRASMSTTWFHCVVKYRDIHGTARETGYYANLTRFGPAISPSHPANCALNYWR